MLGNGGANAKSLQIFTFFSVNFNPSFDKFSFVFGYSPASSSPSARLNTACKSAYSAWIWGTLCCLLSN